MNLDVDTRNHKIRYGRDQDKAFVEALPFDVRCVLQHALKAWATHYDTLAGPILLKLFDGKLHVKLMCVFGMPIVYGMEDHGIHATALAQII